MTRTLLHVGAGPLDVPVLRWARAAGLRVVAADPDPDAVGRREADEFHVLAEDDLGGLLALRADRGDGTWAGVHTLRRSALPSVAVFEASLRGAAEIDAGDAGLQACEATRRRLDPETVRDELRGAGLRVAAPAQVALARGARGFEVNGFLRDGDFVPAGVAEIAVARAQVRTGRLPARLDQEAERELLGLAETAARALGLERGPIGARLCLREGDDGPAVLNVLPMFSPASAVLLAPLALGKSPVQAWFASLAGVGGPFDAMPPFAPATHRQEGGALEGSPATETCAAWTTIPTAARRPGPRPLVDLPGDLGNDSGALSLSPGSETDLASPEDADHPDPAQPRRLFWARGEDEVQLEERLESAVDGWRASERTRIVV